MKEEKNLSTLEHWSKNFRFSNENISAGFSKLQPTSPFETNWGRTFFLKKVICLIILSGNWRKKFRNCGKIFAARLLPLLCKYSREHFQAGQFYWEKKNIFITFGHWAFFLVFHRKHLAGYWKGFLHVHRKNWKKEKIFKSIIFTIYSPGAKNFRLPGKKLGRTAETSFYVSIGSIWASRKNE